VPDAARGERFARTSGAQVSVRDLESEKKRLRIGGILLGIGFGGFADGIVLHQILQWHHMLTSTGDHPASTVAGLETNTLWDGFFHATTWVAAFAGTLLVTRAMRAGFRAATPHLFGLLLAGWGLFNLVEGIVDHHILGIHHVRAGDAELAYDLGFLALGAILLIAGLALARRGERESIARST
jgi:uncharacterized membrane protein